MKEVKYKPHLSLSSKELPQIKTWEVGKKYTLKLEVEMVSQSKGDEFSMMGGDKNQMEGRFKINSVKDLSSKKVGKLLPRKSK